MEPARSHRGAAGAEPPTVRILILDHMGPTNYVARLCKERLGTVKVDCTLECEDPEYGQTRRVTTNAIGLAEATRQGTADVVIIRHNGGAGLEKAAHVHEGLRASRALILGTTCRTDNLDGYERLGYANLAWLGDTRFLDRLEAFLRNALRELDLPTP